MPSSLPAQSEQMYSSQPLQQFQYQTQANAFPTQRELNNNWIKVCTNEVDHYQMKLKGNTAKKAVAGSTNLALPIAIQLY
jgi:hypothetical protein